MVPRILSFRDDESLKAACLAKLEAAINGGALHTPLLKPSVFLPEHYTTASVGIPDALASVMNDFFALRWHAEQVQGGDKGNAEHATLDFLKAIPVGVDLNYILSRWFQWMLYDRDNGLARFAADGVAHSLLERLNALQQFDADAGDADWKQLARDTISAVDAAEHGSREASILQGLEFSITPLDSIPADLLAGLRETLAGLWFPETHKREDQATQELIANDFILLEEKIQRELGPAPQEPGPEQEAYRKEAMPIILALQGEHQTRFADYFARREDRRNVTAVQSATMIDHLLTLLRNAA